MKTLLLDIDTWDLVIDIAGNIAVASNPYSLAQDAASAIKLFQGELWYNTTLGIPYFSQILGRSPPVSLLQALLTAAAKRVPGVVSAESVISALAEREIHGQVKITDRAGKTATAAF